MTRHSTVRHRHGDWTASLGAYVPLSDVAVPTEAGAMAVRERLPVETELETGPLAGLWSALDKEAASKAGTADTSGESEPLSATERLRLEEVAALNEKLRRNPHDVRLWQAFIDAQDRWSQLAHSRSHDTPGSRLTVGQALGRATAGLVERKLAIYERALRELPDDESLLVGYLRCGQEKWEYVRRR